MLRRRIGFASDYIMAVYQCNMTETKRQPIPDSGQGQSLRSGGFYITSQPDRPTTPYPPYTHCPHSDYVNHITCVSLSRIYFTMYACIFGGSYGAYGTHPQQYRLSFTHITERAGLGKRLLRLGTAYECSSQKLVLIEVWCRTAECTRLWVCTHTHTHATLSPVPARNSVT